VAQELFLDRGGKNESVKIGNAKLRSSLELERFLSRKQAFSKKKVFAGIGAFFVPITNNLKKKVFAGFGAFFCPENKRSPKKKGLHRIWNVLLSQIWLRIQVSGGKSRPGEAKISPGGQLPPCPPTSRAYE